MFSVSSMVPVLARDVLDVGAGALGALTAAGSLGAILFGMVMTAAGELRSRGRSLCWRARCAAWR